MPKKGARGLPPPCDEHDDERVDALLRLARDHDTLMNLGRRISDDELGRWTLIRREIAFATKGWEPTAVVSARQSDPEIVVWLLDAYRPHVRKRAPRDEYGVEVFDGVRALAPDSFYARWKAEGAAGMADVERITTAMFLEALDNPRVQSERGLRERAAALIGVLRGRGEGPDAIIALARST